MPYNLVTDIPRHMHVPQVCAVWQGLGIQHVAYAGPLLLGAHLLLLGLGVGMAPRVRKMGRGWRK